MKVVLCDDEYIVVEALKVLVDWQSLGMELIGTAQDGVQALSLVREHKPDIVLSDIRMPGLDGLQLIEIIKEELPSTACVIFSGFNDYHYVKQAIQIGVIDYLEKPITEAAIEKALQKVKAALLQQQQLSLLNQQLAANHQEFIVMRLKEFLLMQQEWDESIEIEQGMPVTSYAEFTICVSDTPFKQELFQDVLLYSFTHHSYAINVLISKDKQAERLIEWLAISNITDQYIGIGATYTEWAGLRSSLEEAMLAYETSSRLQRERIMSIQEISSINNSESTKLEMNELISLRSQLLKAIVEGNAAQFKHLNKGFIAFCEQTRLNYSFIENEILFILLALSKSSIASARSALLGGASFHGFGNMVHSLSITQLLDWYKQQINELSSDQEEPTEPIPGSIARALDYIAQNCDKDLTLQEVAGQVGLHPAYFSMLFKEATGENFVKYRTKCKIDYAKKLLSEGKNVSDVCEQVGFLTYRHFSSVFKQYTGQSPGKYKEQQFTGLH